MKKVFLSIALFGSGTLLNAELFTEYFDNHVVKSKIEYKDGTRTDTQEGIKHGLEEVFYETGELAFTVRNVEGKREGTMDWYSREGKHLEIMRYKNGLRHGLNVIFYDNGNLRIEVNYIDDNKEGPEKYYFDSGKLASEVNFVHGYKEGIQKEYNEDGTLNNEVMYKHGYQEGEKRWFDTKGNIIQTIRYRMDRPIDIMKKVQSKKSDPTNDLLQGLDFNPNNRKVD